VTSRSYIMNGRNRASNRPKFAYPEFLAEGLGECAKKGDPDDFTETSTRKEGFRARNRAKAVCEDCPFRKECAAWAEDTEQSGVWGGIWWRDGAPANKEEEVMRRVAA
jgi:hypothetical protein